MYFLKNGIIINHIKYQWPIPLKTQTEKVRNFDFSKLTVSGSLSLENFIAGRDFNF